MELSNLALVEGLRYEDLTMARKYIGIDIQEGALSAVLLQSGLKTRMVEACAQVPLASGGEAGEALQAGMEALMDQLHPDGHAVILSIPTDHVICRNIQVPFTDAKKIRQIVPFELEPRLAFPVDNLIIDFQKIDSTDNNTRLMVIAAEISRLKSILELASAHHMDPEALVPGAYATGWRLCQRPDMPEDWILLDFSAGRCALLAVHRRKVCLMRSLPAALSSADAAGLIAGHIQQSLAGMDEIIQGAFEPARIVASRVAQGGEVLLNQLSDRLGSKIEIIDLFETEGLKPAPEAPTATTGLNNALACALMAAEGHPGALNFRQGPLSARSRLLEYRPLLLRAGAFLAAALLLALVSVLLDISSLERAVNDTKAQINHLFNSALPNEHTIVDPVHQLTIAMEELKKKAIAAGGERHLPAIDILYDVSTEIPASLNIRLSTLVAGDQSILLTGVTDSFNAVNKMKDHLEKNKSFRIVKINSANMDQNGKRIRFKIMIQL